MDKYLIIAHSIEIKEYLSIAEVLENSNHLCEIIDLAKLDTSNTKLNSFKVIFICDAVGEKKAQNIAQTINEQIGIPIIGISPDVTQAKGAFLDIISPKGSIEQRASILKDAFILYKDIVVVKKMKNKKTDIDTAKTDTKLLLIGGSTGGLESLEVILQNLQPPISFPICLVQHISEEFSDNLLNWLTLKSPIPVNVVKEDTQLSKNTLYVPDNGKHLVIKKYNEATCSNKGPVNFHKPSVSELFISAIDFYQENVCAILLSGMGSDGSKELRKLKNEGAYTIIQSEDTCVVFGMPGVAKKLNAHTVELPPINIAKKINNLNSINKEKL